MQKFVESLNAEQRLAVTTTEGPVLVLAGAGSGKTKVITVRIGWLLHKGAPTDSILAMTFTNKAAGEMRERVGGIVGKDRASELTVGTFHSFCVKLLRANAEKAGLSPQFSICDQSDQVSAMKGALRELRIAEASIQPGALQSKISLLKNKGLTSADFLAKAADDRDELIGRAWQKYEEHLSRARSVDFDDLLTRSVKLFREHESVRTALERRFRYVMVDEYQDTNGPQYDIIKAIAGKHRNLCVVGDDDQSIYGWRGADVAKILSFDKDFHGAKVIRLETNYRSTREILDAANKVIEHNPKRHGKTLKSALGSGEPVALLRMEDETAEADHVAREVADFVLKKRARYADFAVLFRTATQPRVFEQQFRARAVPYTLVGGMSFFDRKEVRDVLAYVRIAQNPLDEVSLLRVINCPPRGVGKTTIEKAVEWATQHGVSVCAAFDDGTTIPELGDAAVYAVRSFRDKLRSLGERRPTHNLVPWLHELLEAVAYRQEVDRCYPDDKTREDRWRSVSEILDMAENHVRRSKKPSLESFLEALTLTSEEDTKDEKESKRDAVMLMTLHAAKGLEFQRVFLVGVEEGLLPHIRSIDEDTVEEERRLMYVGITRAQRHLTISCTKTRSKYGTRIDSMPSRFLYELRGEKPPKGWRAAGSKEEVRGEAPTKKPRVAANPTDGGARVVAKKRARKPKPTA
ncbi:MAG: UvrD-helicase domain-containing protein [Planctomycetota bacterium]|nr:UvrD-helicase domain-containing protein [Planctomycetota bacterium]